MSERTILVVDDEPHIRALLRNILGRANYRVLEAGDGREALEVCASPAVAIDLLLTDVVMPVLDGIGLADQALRIRPDVRVLYMSGKCDFDAVQRDVRDRGFGFIRKPFTIEALLEAVGGLIGSELPKKVPGREKLSHNEPAAGGSSAG